MKAILVLTILLAACTFAKPEGKQEEKSLETTIIELGGCPSNLAMA
jgi:hypothetical protein